MAEVEFKSGVRNCKVIVLSTSPQRHSWQPGDTNLSKPSACEGHAVGLSGTNSRKLITFLQVPSRLSSLEQIESARGRDLKGERRQMSEYSRHREDKDEIGPNRTWKEEESMKM